MNIIVLDFETAYTTEYSLSKITTEAYIRSEKFETIGVAVKVNDGVTEWYSGDFKGTKAFLNKFKMQDHAICAQNAHFDGAILNWIYGIKPAKILDTLSMANVLHGINESVSLANLSKLYGIGEKGTEVVNARGKNRADFSKEELARYGEYCINDVELTYTLLTRMLPQFPKKELKLIDMTVRMFTEPVLKLDKRLLEVALHDIGLERRSLMLKLMNELGVKTEETLQKQLMSNEQFAKLLKENGIEPPRKISPTTGKETWAFAKTDEEFTMLEEHPNPTVQALFAARMGFKSTIGITRTEAFLSISERGTFPFPLKYSGACVTHRWSGFDVNPQNLSRIDPKKPRPVDALRKAIIAPKGFKIVVADLSNIELRLGLWLAGQDDKLDLIRAGVDLYRDFAANAFKVPYDSISKSDPKRFVGKCCISEGTPVLCESGWKPIEQVSINDMLWDGENWVCHQGLVDKGWKETLSVYGSLLTPNHQVWSGQEWMEVQQILANESTLSQALDFAMDSLPSQGISQELNVDLKRSLYDVIVGDLNTRLTNIISNHLSQQDADSVGLNRRTKSDIGFIQKQCQIFNTEEDFLEESQQQLIDAIMQTIRGMRHMGVAELKYQMSGEMINQHFLDMFKHLKDGIILNCNWIEQMLMEIMNPTIYGLSQHQQICTINERLMTLKQKSHVYDLSLAGPLNRFTILTGAGPLIVHNCSLSLIYGTGAVKLQGTVRIQSKGSVTISETESKNLTTLYRNEYLKVVSAWNDGTSVLDAMLKNQTRTFCRDDSIKIVPLANNDMGLLKPSGLTLTYPNLIKGVSKDTGKTEYSYAQRHGRDKVYGAKVFQRVTQSLARDIMAEIIVNIGKTYHVVGTVHDEVVLVVKEDEAEKALEDLLTLMRTAPDWAVGLPLDGEGGIADSYGDAK